MDRTQTQRYYARKLSEEQSPQDAQRHSWRPFSSRNQDVPSHSPWTEARRSLQESNDRRPSPQEENKESRPFNLPPKSLSRPIATRELGQRDETLLRPGVQEPDRTGAGQDTSKSFFARTQARPKVVVNTQLPSSAAAAPYGRSSTDQPPRSSPNRTEQQAMPQTQRYPQPSDQQFLPQAPSRPSESVPVRSPLQKLETTFRDISKEEKRARVQHAENRIDQYAQSGTNESLSWRHHRLDRDNDRPIMRRPTGSGTGANNRMLSSESDQEQPRTHDVAPFVNVGRHDTAPRSQQYHQTSRSTPVTRPAIRTSNSVKSSNSHYGHDAALSGGAAAAALGFYHADQSRYPRPPSPKSDVSSMSDESKENRQDTNIAFGRRVSHTDSVEEQLWKNRTASGDQTIHGDGGRALSSGRAYEQNTSGRIARERVRFDETTAQGLTPGNDEVSHSDIGRRYRGESCLNEWKTAEVARLSKADLKIGSSTQGAERQATSRRQRVVLHSGSGSERRKPIGSSRLPASFQPALVLRCGPLLRYTGMKRGHFGETWRGSVMIVTEDRFSSHDAAPHLRLFRQPSSLLPFPPFEVGGIDGTDLSREHTDPIAGQVKVSRTGESLFVRPAHHLRTGIDLSRLETDEGLFERVKSIQDEPGSSSQSSEPDAEQLGLYQEVNAFRLHTERGYTFWRFNLEVELGSEQMRIAYRINEAPAIPFWVPAMGQSMNIMFHSCNGFSSSADPKSLSGPDPMWRDVLNKHQSKPFHVMIGGGNQIYNDNVMKDTYYFQEWLKIKSQDHKYSAQFSVAMQDELEHYYLDRYSMWFSQGLFAMASSQIPMVNIWDDHDIISVSALLTPLPCYHR